MQMEKYSFNKTYYISVKNGILWYLSHKFDWLGFSFFFFPPWVRFSIRVLFYFRKQGTVSNWLLSTCGSFCSFVWFQLYSWGFSRLEKITWGFFCLNEKTAWPMALGRVCHKKFLSSYFGPPLNWIWEVGHCLASSGIST